MLWPFSLAETLPSWVIMILTVVDLAIRVLALGIIPGNRRPTTAMAWLLIIFFVPAVGLVLFLLFGNFRLSRKRRAQQDAVNTPGPRRHVRRWRCWKAATSGPEWVSSAAELNKTLGSLPMVDGNHVELLPGYPDSIKAMAAAVRKAETFVNAEFYILSSDHVTDDLLTAMEEAAERGVEVRLLFDHLGTLCASRATAS